MDDCGAFTNGPGIADTGVDLLGALEKWVEKGNPPSEILATKASEFRRSDLAEARLRVAGDCDL